MFIFISSMSFMAESKFDLVGLAYDDIDDKTLLPKLEFKVKIIKSYSYYMKYCIK